MGRLRRFLAHPPEERRLFVRALPLVWTVRLGLWFFPFRTVRAGVERVARRPPGRPDPAPAEAARIAWAVSSASRLAPSASCLTRALAAEALLRRRGHAADLRFGVALDERGRLQAHAWIESEGGVLLGDHDLERFTRLEPGRGRRR